MALILIPLNDLAGAEVRLAIERAVVLVGAAGDQPLHVVPFRGETWSDETGAHIEARGVLHAGAGRGRDEPDRPFAGRLREALDATLRVRAHRDKAGDPDQVTVVPVAWYPAARAAGGPDAESAEAERALVAERLQATWSALGGFFDAVEASGFGGLPVERALFEIIPWLFVDGAFDAAWISSFLQDAPRGTAVSPLLYLDRDGTNAWRDFRTYGLARLTTDAVLLHALSSSRAAHREIFGEPDDAPGHWSVLLCHTALFELPMRELVAIERLEALLDGERIETALPDVTGGALDALLRASRDDPAVRDRLASLRKLLTETLDRKTGVESGELRAKLKLRATELGLESSALIPDAARLSSATLTHRVDGAHDEYHAALSGPGQVRLQDLLGEHVVAATEEVQRLLSNESAPEQGLDQIIGGTLTRGDAPPTHAIGRCLALFDGLAEDLSSRHPPSGRGPRPTLAGAVSMAREQRGAWVGSEETLLSATERLPSTLARTAESLALGVAAFLACWLLVLVTGVFRDWGAAPSLVATLSLAGLGAAGIALLRGRQHRAYRRRWQDEVVAAADRDVDAAVDTCHRAIEARVTEARFRTLSSITSALALAKRRLMTEVGGLRRMALAEEALRRRALGAGADQRGRLQGDHATAHFRYLWDVPRGKLPTSALRAWVEDLSRTIALSAVPERLPVARHRRALDDLLSEDLPDAKDLPDGARSQLHEGLSTTIAAGCDPARLPRSGHVGAVASAPRMWLLAGELLRDGAQGGPPLRPPGGELSLLDREAVVAAVNPECAIALTVQRVEVRAEGAGSGDD